MLLEKGHWSPNSSLLPVLSSKPSLAAAREPCLEAEPSRCFCPKCQQARPAASPPLCPRPAFPLASLLPAESYQDFVHRCAVSMGQIVSACPQDAGVTLIVGHGSALDSCTRPLLQLPPRDCADFAQLVRKVPSLGMCFCEENKEEGKWELVNPPVKTLTHGSNSGFNWRSWTQGS